ncbi:lysophospholipid acyltransferase LPEAT1 isoform X1 [Medicago truncatula]|uniref:Phospholipid/glycerol acyltransferase family protein n=1 Tax=Medicago truncatula TaxID=3880 RepID=G7KQU5_MEDTR|nr:lysophospholipid acyltransferase LPEAT1 isoform X1 [Medicago truncatula]AES82037.1 phospholipid/glycerol acyltransferase family protein [Medicago truncatula]
MMKGLESELKDLNSKPPKPNGTTTTATVRDDRPLLKSDSLSSTTTTTAEELQDLEKKFAAYVRNDVYGTMGRGELGAKEKLFLGFALVTLLPIRVILAVTVLVVYYVVCRVCTLFKIPNREDEQEDYAHLGGWRRSVIVKCGKALSRVMLFIFGFYWIHVSSNSFNQENKPQPEETGRPGVIISNHVSYLDILYHMSSSFPSFVAKRSVAKLPLVGLISKCLGCIYVQRESKASDFKGVSAVVTERIREAHQNESAPLMMLFPEGTTTNGDFLLPFKTGGFLAKAPVLPVILKYPYQRFSPAWDSISGVRHVIFLLCQFVNYIEVIQLPIYYPSQQEMDDPKLYADNVRRLMATEGNLILSDIGLAEKRIYHAALNGNNSLPSVLRPKDD